MNLYKRHGFSTEVISEAVWLYSRFNLCHRDIEDLLAERGAAVGCEAIRFWYPKHSLHSWGRLCIKFGAIYTRRLKHKHRGYGDTSGLKSFSLKASLKGPAAVAAWLEMVHYIDTVKGVGALKARCLASRSAVLSSW